MEILSTETVSYMSDTGGIFAVLGILGVLFGLFLAAVGADEGELGVFLVGLAIIVGSICAIVGLHDVGERTYTEHKVIIEDYNEVYKQGYEIVDQDGKITTIRKEVDNDGDSN